MAEELTLNDSSRPDSGGDGAAPVTGSVVVDMGPVTAFDIARWSAALGLALDLPRDGMAVPAAFLPALACAACEQGGLLPRLFGAGGEGEAPPQVVRIRTHLSGEIAVGRPVRVSLAAGPVEDYEKSAVGAGRAVRIAAGISGDGGASSSIVELTILQRNAGPAPAGRARWPQPLVANDNRFWWDGVDRGLLLIQRCKECGTLRHPPGPSCPACGSLSWDTITASGRGTVHSFTINHSRLGDLPSPYVVGLIALDEGVRIVSNIVGIDPADVRIGMEVEVRFRPANSLERAMPLFVPAGGDGALPACLGAGTGLEPVDIELPAARVAGAAVAGNNLSPLHRDPAAARAAGYAATVLDLASAAAFAHDYLRRHDPGRIEMFEVAAGRPVLADTVLTIRGSRPGAHDFAITASTPLGGGFEAQFSIRDSETSK